MDVPLQLFKSVVAVAPENAGFSVVKSMDAICRISDMFMTRRLSVT